MLSPDHYYPEEDFDVDYGLDLDQFEYGRPPQSRNQGSFDYLESAPYDEYGYHHGHYREDSYSPKPPYDAEYNDNIVMKTRPDYNEIPGRPFEPRVYYGEDRYVAMDRRSVSYHRQPQPRHHHEPRMREDPHYSSRGHGVYSRNHRHDAYGNRNDEDNYGRDHEFYSSARYKRPSSSYMEEAPQSTRSYRSPPRSASHKKTSRGSQHKRSANRERVRNFPAPDSKLPPIPPPDYDGSDVGVKYVPQPDY